MNAKPPARVSIGVESNPETVAKYDYPEGARIITGCAFDYLRGLLGQNLKGWHIYADPPYMDETRKGGGEYGKHELTDKQHVELLKLLIVMAFQGATVQISGYDSPIYARILADWRKVTYRTMTHAGPVEECLWLSYGDCAPHWHTYAGANKTERQQIKRKAARWAAKYREMSFGERLAIRDAMDRIDRDPAQSETATQAAGAVRANCFRFRRSYF